MRAFVIRMMLMFVVLVVFSQKTVATEMYFTPDTTVAAIGDTILFTAHITASDTVRGFTVYMVYDTNDVDLVGAPTPGALIAGLPGLDFRYADHIIAAPAWLEVGATVFGTTYWAGPGAVFQLRLVMRDCGEIPMTGSFGMRRPNGSFIPGDFTPPRLFVCDPVPAEPESLTVFWTGSAAHLRWKLVTLNTWGFALPDPPLYVIYRAEEQSNLLPYMAIDTIVVNEYFDNTGLGNEHLYYVKAFAP